MYAVSHRLERKDRALRDDSLLYTGLARRSPNYVRAIREIRALILDSMIRSTLL